MYATDKEVVRAACAVLLMLLAVLGCRSPFGQPHTAAVTANEPAEEQHSQHVDSAQPSIGDTLEVGFAVHAEQADPSNIERVQFSAPQPGDVNGESLGGPHAPTPALPYAPSAGGAEYEFIPHTESERLLPRLQTDAAERYPIDLSTALRLAGANNLQIALARERVFEAQGRLDAADVLCVPSLSAGAIYNKHDGRLQATEGDVVEVSRNSLFVGGGPVLANAPLAGGAGGPRLFVDLALADVLFEPLAARQDVQAADAQQSAVFNDTLLEVTTAYLALVNAQAAVAIAREAVQNAERLVQITQDFARTGVGLQADAQRARADLAARQRSLYAAEENLAVVSAELSRLLRLDATVILYALDEAPIPLELVDEATPLPALIAQGLAARPELRDASAQIEGTYARLRQEEVRPWLPYLYIGYSAGGFGGGTGSSIDSFGSRGDFDAGAVWSWNNLGLGNLARQRERESLYNQAQLTAGQVRDRVAIEVAQAYHRVRSRRQQTAASRAQVVAAADALQLNLEGIQNLALRPIEAQQAIDALANARQRYSDAIIDFDRAQFELLRAIGTPPTTGGP